MMGWLCVNIHLNLRIVTLPARTAILNVLYGQTATKDRHCGTQKGCLSLFDYNSKVVCHIHKNNHQIDFTDRIERIKNYI